MKWQPIETAPRDGTRILCYFPGKTDPELYAVESISVAYWREFPPEVKWELVDVERELWRRSTETSAFFISEDEISIEPTHWMPLPAPPEANT